MECYLFIYLFFAYQSKNVYYLLYCIVWLLITCVNFSSLCIHRSPCDNFYFTYIFGAVTIEIVRYKVLNNGIFHGGIYNSIIVYC